MQLSDITLSTAPTFTSVLPFELSAEVLLRAAAIFAAQAENLADEIEGDPTLVDNAPDTLRLFAALMREAKHATPQPAIRHA